MISATVPPGSTLLSCEELFSMSRIALFRLTLIALWLVLPAGCSSNEQDPQSAAASKLSAPDGPLTAADLERFLAVVQNHSEAMIPEFTPPDDDEALDMTAPAAELVALFRSEVRRLFDITRQGAIWERDGQWSQALATQKISAAQFAGLVRKVSLAIMRVRLDARVDIDQLVVQA